MKSSLIRFRRLSTDEAYLGEAIAMSKKGKVFYSREHVATMWDRFYQRALAYKDWKLKKINDKECSHEIK